MYDEFLRRIGDGEMKKWKPQQQGITVGIIEAFLNSDMKMAEVDLDKLSQPEPREGASPRSTKQDSFASSFYAWKKKQSTKEALDKMGVNVILIRRGEKIALKKKEVGTK